MLKKLILILPLMLGGCISTYLDNSLPPLDYTDISRRAQTTPVTLEASSLNNGKFNEDATVRLNVRARETLNASQVFTVVDNDPNAAKIKIRLDEQFSGSGAFARGFLTGFTFGIVGTTSTENMVMDISLTVPGHEELAKKYEQKVYLNIGLTASTPDKSTKVENGYNEAVKKLILNYIQDLQHGGAI